MTNATVYGILLLMETIMEPPKLLCTAGGCDGEMKLVDRKQEPFKTAILGPNIVGHAVKHTYERDCCGFKVITT